MEGENNIWGWVVGVVVVVLIVLGLWWYLSASPGTGTTATSTPNGVATTTTPSVSTEVRSSSTVAAVVASLSGAGTFQSLFTSTGVAASLTGKGPYTVFVPEDKAFNDLPAGTISNMTAAAKKRLVQYHVVSGKTLDVDAVSNGTYVALSKDSLNFTVRAQDKSVFVNSGFVYRQYKASNGIVYVISAVLVPPTTASSTQGH